MRATSTQLLQALRSASRAPLQTIGNEQLVRPISSAVAGPWLYRDFIQQSLYHPELGYFNKPQPPVQRLTQPINFNRILNQAEYNLVLAKIYKQLQVDWLTPVEVFAPWYGRAIAHYILEVRKHTLKTAGQPLSIVEIGGGTGTLAASILDYIADREPITYSTMTYSTIELSSSLAAAQQDLVVQQRGHATAWRCIHADAASPQAWADVSAAVQQRRHHHQQQRQQHTFVLMMEVLDNLPHDRVVRSSVDEDWQQVVVLAQQQQQQPADSHSGSKPLHHPQQPQQLQQQSLTEVLQPAHDPLIQRCLQALYPRVQKPSYASGHSSRSMFGWFQDVLGLPNDAQDPLDVWLPTRCLQLLDTLHAALPSHSLITADFDALPDIKVPGRNAPLVSGRSADKCSVDYDTVLVPWGSADIFFPTDFDDLQKLYKAAVAEAQAGQQVEQQQFHGAVEGSVQQQPQERGSNSKNQYSSRSLSCSHSSTADFMSAFAEARRTCLLSGFNPLVQEWPNTRVLVGHLT